MAVAITEADDLILDRRAIARPQRLDRAREQRRSIETLADDRVGAGVGPRDRTRELRQGAPSADRCHRPALDRKSVVEGKRVLVSVDLGVRGIIKKKNSKTTVTDLRNNEQN